MERLEGYRHFVEPKVKKLFISSIKKAIKQIDKSKFGFIGFIGSLNSQESSHDIDILIFPNLNAKIGEVILEIAKLYDYTEQELKKHHERYYIAACPKKSIQELTYYISSIEEGAVGLIPIHSLFFTNYKDFKNSNPKEFQKEIKKTLTTLYGKFDVIKELPIISQKKLDPYFLVLDFEMTSRIKTFPKHLMRASAESLFGYLKSKYNIEINDKIPSNPNEVHKEFKKLIKLLDKRTYS